MKLNISAVCTGPLRNPDVRWTIDSEAASRTSDGERKRGIAAARVQRYVFRMTKEGHVWIEGKGCIDVPWSHNGRSGVRKALCNCILTMVAGDETWNLTIMEIEKLFHQFAQQVAAA